MHKCKCHNKNKNKDNMRAAKKKIVKDRMKNEDSIIKQSFWKRVSSKLKFLENYAVFSLFFNVFVSLNRTLLRGLNAGTKNERK